MLQCYLFTVFQFFSVSEGNSLGKNKTAVTGNKKKIAVRKTGGKRKNVVFKGKRGKMGKGGKKEENDAVGKGQAVNVKVTACVNVARGVQAHGGGDAVQGGEEGQEEHVG